MQKICKNCKHVESDIEFIQLKKCSSKDFNEMVLVVFSQEIGEIIINEYFGCKFWEEKEIKHEN